MDIELDPRRAGSVLRWHTCPRLHEQSVGEHCWNLARILLAIWPECPREIIVHALMHDIGEGKVGDVPYIVKRSSPTLKTAFNDLEKDVHLKMTIPWGVPPPIKLAHDYQKIFKLAEYIEMWEWTLHELSLGNNYAKLPNDRCFVRIMDAVKKDVDGDIRTAAQHYLRRRLAYYETVTQKNGEDQDADDQGQ